jgi:hypothetical protein
MRRFAGRLGYRQALSIPLSAINFGDSLAGIKHGCFRPIPRDTDDLRDLIDLS